MRSLLLNPQAAIIRIIILLITLPVHEFAHAFMAYKMGDPTAKNLGRLTLNPMAHLDPIGSLCLVFFGFGWAKPVPVNPAYFENNKFKNALVAFAGPASNLIMSYLSMVVLKILIVTNMITSTSSMLYLFFAGMVQINIVLAVFNLLPIPPLDGSRIASIILPEKWYWNIQKYERYIYYGLLFCMVLGVFDGVIGTLSNGAFQLMNTLTSFIHT